VTTFALVPGKPLVAGRDEEADIRLDDGAVSRKHVVFHPGPPLEIEDLGSSNGTFVSSATARVPAAGGTTDTTERRRITATRMALGVGDSVFLGSAVLVVRPAKAPTSEPRLSAGDAVVREPSVVRVYEEAARAAQLSMPILIVGETGVGKDVLAKFIHRSSRRAKAPFVALNCGALSETLADSQLFGHEKGAFTGAQQARPGLFESADGGTVFLDEIGELPMATQAKLLRTLENSEVQRLGSTRPTKVNVRFVSATNGDLEQATRDKTFRSDLYFRVNGITLRLPPLRERPKEIAELARRFLEAASKQAGLTAVPELSNDALRVLEGYAWPGNVRELRWMMERLLVNAGEGPILLQHLPEQLTEHSGTKPASGPIARGDGLATREAVIEALDKCDGNQTHAAELLGVSRRTLINRMIDFNLPRPRKG
jgi:DNA-binding NtrC family response regulator